MTPTGSHTTSLLLFFNDTATTEIYTLSLHDALPILFANAFIPKPPGVPSKAYARPHKPSFARFRRLYSAKSLWRVISSSRVSPFSRANNPTKQSKQSHYTKQTVPLKGDSAEAAQ